MLKYQIRILFCIVISFIASVQTYSQLSKTHYIPPISSAEFGNANPEDQYIYLSTPRGFDVPFTIKPVGQPTTSYITGVVSNTNPISQYLGTGFGQLVVPGNLTSLVANKGYIIEADDLIYVSVRLNAGGAAQAGALVSKGLSALGTTFRVGSFTNQNPQDNYQNFVAVMATEDNTTVTFSDLPTGIAIKNYSGSIPITTTLNKGESYIVATNSFDNVINRDGLIGALVSSDNPIVVNCGSANGSFHNGGGRDYGIDQIVDLSKVGTEYIFVKGGGNNDWENVLIVAHTNNTTISINGAAPITTINAGEYYLIEGNNYNSFGNMYVETSQPVFAYQGVGANTNEANQGMFFVPPLSCETRGNLNNIANIEKIGATVYTGGITIVTKKGATVTINNTAISSFSTVGPNDVDGNTNYVTYKVTNLTGNISVQSTDELYCAYFNVNGAATSGSFYSGFPTAPEINFDAAFSTLGICIPNIKLEAANMDNFDSIEWFFNDGSGFVPTGVTTLQYTPTVSGTYKLIGLLSCSGLTLESLEVPVSICPDDSDNDGIIDNIDKDNDNDGILNCIESFGDQTINLSSITGGTISAGSYSYSGITSTIGNVATTPIIGDAFGNFMSDLPNKSSTIETNVSYTLNFNKELNILLEYASANSLGTNPITNEAEFTIKVPNTKTITLLNPNGQLLVDTNYDGIYEAGITQFSSFEIRFKLATNSLALGSGTFSFNASGINSITYIHKNTSETNTNQATFKISATCLPKDNDSDGIIDAFDYDSDNDGIPDIIENIGSLVVLSGIDIDLNGVDDVFNNYTLNIDSDNDGVPNYYDLDSDNDGITDLIETNQLGVFSDTDLNGIIDSGSSFGVNGWIDAAETSPDSNIASYTLPDLDGDSLFNFMDYDSDGDLCSDVIEAGFFDGNNDDFLGNSTVVVNSNGLVTNATNGYTLPNANYLIAAPITIITQPTNQISCELSSTIFNIETNTINSYQWQVSTDGVIWTNITNNAIYSNTTTNTLTISNTPLSYNNYYYRVQLNTAGNTCGLISDEVTLTVNPLPVLTTPVVLKQCDNDTDGFSYFNLTEVNNKISTNAINETFTYYTSLANATSGTNEISTPTAYQNQTINSDTVWARVTSQFGCIQISEIQLIVSTTGIPATFQRTFSVCDDYVDNVNNNRDGISTFNFSSVDAEVKAIFPIGQLLTIKYYRNEADALSETNEILDISNYRNIGYPNTQQIYIRVDSQLDNDCLGFGNYITLNVEALPFANTVTIARQCDDNQDGQFPFDTAAIENTVLNGQTGVTVAYFDESNNPLPSPLPNPFLSASQTLTIRVTNTSTLACFDETTLQFIVDEAPIANPVTIAPACDDESNDGIHNFDTSSIQTTILGTQTGMEVHYFNASGTELSSPLPNPFTTATQTISVQVINPINTTCIANTNIDFTVNPLPDFEVSSPQILCITDPVSTINLEVYPNNPSEIFDYLWTNSKGEVLSINNNLDTSIADIYTITLTKTDGTNCARTKEIEVVYSEISKIDLDAITIKDDSDNNTITINTASIGVGDYEFSLDDEFFGYQDETLFENVTPGIHTLYIRDKNLCGTVSLEIPVIGYPKFFTPNNDGYNDTWQVLGISNSFYANSNIYIFDRFGKLITKINTNSNGWDGTYKGEFLTSTDYWFKVELIDNKGNVKIRKGHFSLIR